MLLQLCSCLVHILSGVAGQVLLDTFNKCFKGQHRCSSKLVDALVGDGLMTLSCTGRRTVG
jgi:hypothetical protein